MVDTQKNKKHKSSGSNNTYNQWHTRINTIITKMRLTQINSIAGTFKFVYTSKRFVN